MHIIIYNSCVFVLSQNLADNLVSLQAALFGCMRRKAGKEQNCESSGLERGRYPQLCCKVADYEISRRRFVIFEPCAMISLPPIIQSDPMCLLSAFVQVIRFCRIQIQVVILVEANVSPLQCFLMTGDLSGHSSQDFLLHP